MFASATLANLFKMVKACYKESSSSSSKYHEGGLVVQRPLARLK